MTINSADGGSIVDRPHGPKIFEATGELVKIHVVEGGTPSQEAVYDGGSP